MTTKRQYLSALQSCAPVLQEDLAADLRAAGFIEKQITKAVEVYNRFATRTDESEARLDAEDVKEMHETLRREWGSAYAGNLALTKDYVKSLPPEVHYGLLTATTADGRLLLNQAAGAQWLLQLANSQPHQVRLGDAEIQTLRAARTIIDALIHG